MLVVLGCGGVGEGCARMGRWAAERTSRRRSRVGGCGRKRGREVGGRMRGSGRRRWPTGQRWNGIDRKNVRQV